MTRNNSLGFNKELFLRLSKEPWTEGPRLDYKEQLFACSNDDEKFKYIKLLIALANISRRTGKETYILFGIKDKTRELIGIQGQFVGKANPGVWDDPNVDMQTKQVEYVIDQLHKIAGAWIEPDTPEFDYEYGEVNGVFVSYLTIKPSYTSVPFSLKRPFKNLSAGTVFVRKGSASLPLNPSEVKNLLPKSSTAYLSRQEWENFINFHASGDFLKVAETYPFLDVKVNGDQPVSALRYLLDSVVKAPNKFLISGKLGMGKSFLLRKLAYSISQKHISSVPPVRKYYGESTLDDVLSEQVYSVENDLEVLPNFPVPLFFNLRFGFSTRDEFEILIINEIQKMSGVKNLTEVRSLFNIIGSQWILFFDGLDELRNSKISGPILRSWITTLPENVSVCISSRPGVESFEGFQEVQLLPLDPTDVKNFILKSLEVNWYDEIPNFDQNPITEIGAWLDSNTEIYMVLTNLRAVQAFLNLFTPSSQRLINIDNDKVILDAAKEITEEISPEFATNSSALPKIDENLLLNTADEISYEIENNERDALLHDEENENKKSIVLPTTAITFQGIVDYIQEEEIKRRADFGINPRRTANQARITLDKLAWLINWTQNRINTLNLDNRSFDKDDLCWFEDMGFLTAISEKNYWLYQFACFSLMYFFAAEHAFHAYEDIEKLEEQLKAKKPLSAVRRVIQMINELRKENGKNEFNISFMEATV